MKQFILGFVLSSFSGIMMADAEPDVNSETFDLCGFYFGGSAGESILAPNEAVSLADSFNYPENDTLHNFYLNGARGISSDKAKGTLFAGTGYAWQFVYLGAEAFASLSKHQMQSTHSGGELQTVTGDFTSTLHTKNSFLKLNSFEYGADLRPGILFSPGTLFYGRVGFAVNQLSLNVHSTGTESFLPPTFPVSESLPINLISFMDRSRVNLRLGLGLEQLINPHLAVRLDYIHTDYGKIATSGVTNSFQTSINRGPTFLELDHNIPINVSDNTILVGLSYRMLNATEQNPMADPADCALGCFDGFYTGIEGGGSFTSGTEAISGLSQFIILEQDNFETDQPINASSKLKSNSGKGVLFVGYGRTHQSFYLGGEVFGSVSNDKYSSNGSRMFYNTFEGVLDSIDSTSVNSRIKLNSIEYGLNLRPGFLATVNTLLYANVGMAFNRLKLDAVTTSYENFLTFEDISRTRIASPPPVLFFLSLASNASKQIAALRIGGGIEQHITPKFTVRADYVYTNYGKISINDSTSKIQPSEAFGPVQVIVSNQSSFNFSNSSVLFGVSYYFS